MEAGKERCPFKKASKLLRIICAGLKNTTSRYISVENATVIPRQTMMPPLCG
jgi:hypothetical protein